MVSTHSEISPITRAVKRDDRDLGEKAGRHAAVSKAGQRSWSVPGYGSCYDGLVAPPSPKMDKEDDLQNGLDLARRQEGTGAPEPEAMRDESDQDEMTSVMGPEERRLLQQAARNETRTAPPEVVREEALTRPTARPPPSRDEAHVPAIVNVPVDPVAREHSDDAAGAPAPLAGETQGRPQPPSRAWPVVAFLLLVAAAVYAVQR